DRKERVHAGGRLAHHHEVRDERRLARHHVCGKEEREQDVLSSEVHLREGVGGEHRDDELAGDGHAGNEEGVGEESAPGLLRPHLGVVLRVPRRREQRGRHRRRLEEFLECRSHHEVEGVGHDDPDQDEHQVLEHTGGDRRHTWPDRSCDRSLEHLRGVHVYCTRRSRKRNWMSVKARMISVSRTPIAEPSPICPCWKKVLKSNSVTVRVVSSGPPFVSTKISLKARSTPMLAMVKTKKICGERSGRVIRRKS